MSKVWDWNWKDLLDRLGQSRMRYSAIGLLAHASYPDVLDLSEQDKRLFAMLQQRALQSARMTSAWTQPLTDFRTYAYC